MPTLYNISLSNTEYISMGKNLISNEAKDNIIFMDNGVIMNRNGVIEYNFFNKDFKCYVWNRDKYREIVPSLNILQDKDMIKHYLSGIAVSEYLIKNTGK
jgi:hypothetical protein